jgi:DNA-binding beta-propeller fold protein YncE
MSRRQWLATAVGVPLAAVGGGLLLSKVLPNRWAHADIQQSSSDLLAVTCSRGRSVAIVVGITGVVATIDAGAAPHNIARHPDGRGFVSTAEGVAVLALQRRQRTALLPYLVDVGPPQFGEFRPGGMGIAVTPDGRRVAVGVYRPVGSTLEIIDAVTLDTLGSVAIGVRPFQVLAAPDSRHVYSIDHDSYTVTVVDLDTQTTRQLPAQPLGRGAFDKPHYAAQRADGALLLPYQGRALQMLDPASGSETVLPLSAQTHQHGVALTPDQSRLLIVGTGPAGGVSGDPGLTILTLATGAEEIVPLTRAHELVVVTNDGKRAYLTGGNLLTGGWNGLTLVDLETRATREIAVPDAPLDAVLL